MELDGFPLPTLVRITGPVGLPNPLPPGQDRVNWWAYVSDTEFIAVPPSVVEEMVDSEGGSVWESQRGESPADSLDRVRLLLNGTAASMSGPVES
jgi:hypothetical protein